MNAGMTGKPSTVTEELALTLDEDQLLNCMRCGFCQTACPTFNETGLEAASPRGRIALMKAVVDGLMEPDEAFGVQMDLCLGCRACEPACPSDVKYGRLIEQTRVVLATHAQLSRRERWVRGLFFKELLIHPKRMRLLGRGLRLYQNTGLQGLLRRVGAFRVLPPHLREMEAIMPEASGQGVLAACRRAGIPCRSEVAAGKPMLVIPAVGEAIARVGMFRGCIMDILFTGTNVNTVRLLRQAGFTVVIPEAQTCCGALHGHAGDLGAARQLAVQNTAVFQAAGVDYIASNAGGCGAFLKEYDHLLHEDAECASSGKWFSARVKDVSELLVDVGRPLPVKAASVPSTVTYQDSCHLRNVMRVKDQPRTLLASLPGIQFQELHGADRCCGSAGIYNLTQPDMSSQILDHKMQHVDATGANRIVTTNPGCQLQMQWGLGRSSTQTDRDVIHLVDLLAEHIQFSSK